MVVLNKSGFFVIDGLIVGDDQSILIDGFKQVDSLSENANWIPFDLKKYIKDIQFGISKNITSDGIVLLMKLSDNIHIVDDSDGNENAAILINFPSGLDLDYGEYYGEMEFTMMDGSISTLINSDNNKNWKIKVKSDLA